MTVSAHRRRNPDDNGGDRPLCASAFVFHPRPAGFSAFTGGTIIAPASVGAFWFPVQFAYDARRGQATKLPMNKSPCHTSRTAEQCAHQYSHTTFTIPICLQSSDSCITNSLRTAAATSLFNLCCSPTYLASMSLHNST